MSLRTRIAAAAAGAVAVVVLVAAAAIYFGVRAELRSEVDSSLRDRAALFEQLAGGSAPGPAPDGRGHIAVMLELICQIVLIIRSVRDMAIDKEVWIPVGPQF